MDQVKFFKGCLSQILRDPFSNNTLSQMISRQAKKLELKKKEYVSTYITVCRFKPDNLVYPFMSMVSWHY